MTNMTTSAGFATFIFTQSQPKRIWYRASINIMVFVLSLRLFPPCTVLCLYQKKHLKHLEKWIHKLVEKMVLIVRIENHNLYRNDSCFDSKHDWSIPNKSLW